MSKYALISRNPATGLALTSQTFPGYVALGWTLEETRELIDEAMDQHLAAMRRAPSVVDAEFREVA